MAVNVILKLDDEEFLRVEDQDLPLRIDKGISHRQFLDAADDNRVARLTVLIRRDKD